MKMLEVRSLVLAMRAVEGAASALADAANRNSAVRARLSVSVINGASQLKASCATIAMHVVAYAAASSGNRLFEGLANGLDKDPVSFTADAVGCAQRRNTGQEQAFRSVNIADADNQVAVHQEWFDRRAAVAGPGEEPVGIKLG